MIKWRPWWWQRFWKQWRARWAVRTLLVLIVLAVFSPFIANELPLFCKIENQSTFPVIKSIFHSVGLSEKGPSLREIEGATHIVRTPIPYSSNTIDFKNAPFVGPFSRQNIESFRWRHWLGTDKSGRDVLAGLLNGLRVGLLIGFLSTMLASVIGITLGMLAGYFGNEKFRVSWWKAIIGGVFFIAMIYVTIRSHQLGGSSWLLLIGIALVAAVFMGFSYLPEAKYRWRLPLDQLVMSTIEILQSLPGLMLLIVISALIGKTTVWSLAIIIGLLVWTSIARFTRGEMIKIRSRPYLLSAELLGLPTSRILVKYVLPNLLSPLLITISFTFAGVILAEASLSFLGIGTDAEIVTWGKQLNAARDQFSAWWMAVFPGLALYVVLSTFVVIGQSINKAVQSNS